MSGEKKYESQVLNLLKQIADQTKEKSKEESSEPSKIEEGIVLGDKVCKDPLNCPEHYPILKEKVLLKEHKATDWFCNDCGYPLGDTENAKKQQKCPSCGGEHGKHKD